MFLVLIIVFLSLIVPNSNACTTPNGNEGQCVSLFSCPHLMKIIGSMESTSLEFIKRSLCSSCSFKDIMVCCGSTKDNAQPPSYNISEDIVVQSKSIKIVHPQRVTNKNNRIARRSVSEKIKHTLRNFVKEKLLPSKRYCGYQHTDDRIYEDIITAFDEYPWLVSIASSLIEDSPGYYVGDRCNGVLISNRYVLTYSDCAHHALKVKLGQYNTHLNISCTENPTYKECSEVPLEIRVEEKIRNGDRLNGEYDFALLRLAERVQYTDFIRPICLPLKDEPTEANPLIFSGWGTWENSAIIKKRLVYDVIEDQVCYNHYEYLEQRSKSAQANLICVLAQKNNLDIGCHGDYGGPLMYSKRHQWFVEGVIVSISYCNNTIPIVGLRITAKIVNWILSSIRP